MPATEPATESDRRDACALLAALKGVADDVTDLDELAADLDRMVEWIDVIIATAEAEQTQFRMAAAMTALQAVAVVVRAESDRLLAAAR